MKLKDKLSNYKIYLASSSPRRKELLRGLDIPFEIKVIENIDESYPKNLPVNKIASYLANKKAEVYEFFLEDNTLLITADTLVIKSGKVLGKPSNYEEAKSMLQQLSGEKHKVITGTCIITKREKHLFTDVSEVIFSVLTEDEIDYYIKKYHPLDKAGAYGIQEWMGYIGIEKISGSYYNIMGLPVHKIYKTLNSIK